MPATHAAPWERNLRQMVKATHGRGWTLAPHRGGRTQLRRRWSDGTSSSATLATPWQPSSAPALLAAVEQIAQRMAAEPTLGLADAAEQLQLTSVPAAGAAAVRLASLDWPALVERYRLHMVEQSGTVKASTWANSYRGHLQELLPVLSRKPAPRSGKAALAQLIQAHPGTPGGRGRQERIGNCARFLRWAVEHAGADARFMPPADLSDLNGRRMEARQASVPLPDEHALRIWRELANPRWRLAFGLMVCFGLRPAELDLLQVEGQALRVGGLKRTMAGAKGSRLVPPLDPIEAPGMGAGLLAVLAERGRAGLPDVKVGGWAKAVHRVLHRHTSWPAVVEELETLGRGRLTPYGCRHGYAWRGGQTYRLTPRVLAAAMGHTVATHLQHYGEGAAAEEVLAAVDQARARVMPR